MQGKMPKNKRPRSSDDEDISRPKRIKPDSDEGTAHICPICIEPVSLSGSHFIVALKCGHIFGDSCVRNWLSVCPVRLQCCPTCKARAVFADIRKLYSTNIIVVDNQSGDEMIEVRKKLEELQKEMDMLKLLGVKYCECEICDLPFCNEAQKIKHKIENHRERFHQTPGHGFRDNIQPE